MTPHNRGGALPPPSWACHACGSTTISVHRASRQTRNVVHACRECGAYALANRPPPDELAGSYDWDEEKYASYVRVMRYGSGGPAQRQVIEDLDRLVPQNGHRRTVFDVGAGSGSFLALARDAGFDVSGNELAAGAVALAKREYDVDLHLGDLAQLEEIGPYDAVTMWCVLAHVSDHSGLLAHVRRVLSPGGVVFLQTPRRSAMDRAGIALLEATSGRASRLVDRRMARHHMILHTERSIRAQMERAGFEVLEVRSSARYSLTTETYLRSLGMPVRGLGRTADRLIERGWFFRNVLDVHARRVD